MSSNDDTTCNVEDDQEEHGPDEKAVFALSDAEQDMLDSKLFLNPKAFVGTKNRRWTTDTAGSIIMWHHNAMQNSFGQPNKALNIK